MERKIGEIFEYGGEWYQCLPEIQICVGCAFKNKTCKKNRGIRGECERASRQTDGVIFKKLKKVGEPYEYFVQHRGIVMLQPYKLFATPFINGVVCNVNYDTNTIDLEIKQNKEDMEEEREYTEDEFKNSPRYQHHKNIEQVINMKKMKEFDINLAKQGKPVCTRDGRKARIICFDKKGAYPIVALVNDYNEEEYIKNYDEFGKKFIGGETSDDLMMLPEKREGWTNVYKDGQNRFTRGFFQTIEMAKNATNPPGATRIATVRIEWEE